MNNQINVKILEQLKRNMPEYVSGEALSEFLGVSRTAVWKHIRELKQEGYAIESSSKKGYRLGASDDIFNAYEISSGLETKILGENIKYFDEIDSTNNCAKSIAAEGCADGTVIIADVQNSGRGRLGRTWVSTGGKGIWMSIVLRPSIQPEEVQIITLAASVAVVRAISSLFGVKAGIKWPNDILIGSKKACGILTEMNAEMERVNYVVLGIGINVNHETGDFPEELAEVATSLKIQIGCEKVVKRSAIVKEVLKELESIYQNINFDYERALKDIITSWKEYSITLYKKVKITVRGTEFIGTAVDITGDGKLVVDCEDGIRREVLSGEVSVRGLLGYV
jgi:BirA family transcriptional regulator, biotin operon repressor / biotin---[acetyl-CoA-carboxylase] ligase